MSLTSCRHRPKPEINKPVRIRNERFRLYLYYCCDWYHYGYTTHLSVFIIYSNKLFSYTYDLLFSKMSLFFTPHSFFLWKDFSWLHILLQHDFYSLIVGFHFHIFHLFLFIDIIFGVFLKYFTVSKESCWFFISSNTLDI